MKKHILILLFFMLSCGHKLDSKVEKAVSYISKYETLIMADFVCKNTSYINLMSVVSIDDLVYLTNDKNPVVRYFAFVGLLERNYAKIDEVYDSHKDDAEVILTSNGACIIESVSINSLMKQAMSRNSVYTAYFSKNRYHLKN